MHIQKRAWLSVGAGVLLVLLWGFSMAGSKVSAEPLSYDFTYTSDETVKTASVMEMVQFQSLITNTGSEPDTYIVTRIENHPTPEDWWMTFCVGGICWDSLTTVAKSYLDPGYSDMVLLDIIPRSPGLGSITITVKSMFQPSLSKSITFLLTAETHGPPQTMIVEPNDTSMWDKNYFSDTLSIQAIDFQAVSNVEYTLFEYFYDGTWHDIGTDHDGTIYMKDPWDTLQPGGDGWHAQWAPGLTTPEGYYMIRATMVDSTGMSTSDTIVQYYDPHPPEVNIIYPDVFNFPFEDSLDISFDFGPGSDPFEGQVCITSYPVSDYPGFKGEGCRGGKSDDCIQGYNKGVPHINQHDVYPNGTDGKNRGCSPTSLAACLKYWAQNGYPGLNNNGTMTDAQMVAEIAANLGTHPDKGTDTKKSKAAAEKYIKDHIGECKFRPVIHLQGKDVTQKRLIQELFEQGEDVIAEDNHHVTVANSFCVHPKFYIDYMDPWTGTEVQNDNFKKGFDGDPLTDLIIISPKVDTVGPVPDTVATTGDILPILGQPGKYHYPWHPDPTLFPVGHAYFVNVELTDLLGHGAWDLVKVEPFKRGDATGNGTIDVGDVVYLINYLFKSGTPPFPLDAGDATCDGKVDVGDVVYLINYLFKGGLPPVCP